MRKILIIVCSLGIILAGCGLPLYEMQKGAEISNNKITEENLKTNSFINNKGFACLSEYVKKEYQEKFDSCVDVRSQGNILSPMVTLTIDSQNRAIYKSKSPNFPLNKNRIDFEDQYGTYCVADIKYPIKNKVKSTLLLRNNMRFNDSNQLFVDAISDVQELKLFSRPYESDYQKNILAEYNKSKLSIKTDEDFVVIINQGISKCY